MAETNSSSLQSGASTNTTGMDADGMPAPARKFNSDIGGDSENNVEMKGENDGFGALNGDDTVVEEIEEDEDSLFIGKREDYGLEPYGKETNRSSFDLSDDEELYDEAKMDEEVKRCTRKPRKYKMKLKGGVFKPFTRPIEPLPDYEDGEEEGEEGEIIESRNESMDDLTERLENIAVSNSKSKKRGFEDEYEEPRASKKVNTSATASILANNFLTSLGDEILANDDAKSAEQRIAHLETQNEDLMFSMDLLRSELLHTQDDLRDAREAHSKDSQLLNDRILRIGDLEENIRTLEAEAVSNKREYDILAKKHSTDSQALAAAEHDLKVEKEKYNASIAENARLVKGHEEEIKKEKADIIHQQELMQVTLKNLHDRSQQEIEKREQAKLEAAKTAEDAKAQGAQSNIDLAIAQGQIERMTKERDTAIQERDRVLFAIQSHLAQEKNASNENSTQLQLSSLYDQIESSLMSNYESRYQDISNEFYQQQAAMAQEKNGLNILLSEAKNTIGQLEQEKNELTEYRLKAEQKAKEDSAQWDRQAGEHQDLSRRFDEVSLENQRMKAMLESPSRQPKANEDDKISSNQAGSPEQEIDEEFTFHQEAASNAQSSMHQKLAEAEQKLAKTEKELAGAKKEITDLRNTTAPESKDNPEECAGCRNFKDNVKALSQELAARDLDIKTLKQCVEVLSDRAIQKAVLAETFQQKLNASENKSRMERLECDVRDAKKSASNSDREVVKQKEYNEELQVKLKQLSKENKKLRNMPKTRFLVAEEGKAKYAENQQILDIAQKMLGTATSEIVRAKKSEQYMKSLLQDQEQLRMMTEGRANFKSTSSQYISLRALWEGRIETLEKLLKPEHRLCGLTIDFGCLEKYSQALIQSPEVAIAKALGVKKAKTVLEDLSLAVVVKTCGEGRSAQNVDAGDDVGGDENEVGAQYPSGNGDDGGAQNTANDDTPSKETSNNNNNARDDDRKGGGGLTPTNTPDAPGSEQCKQCPVYRQREKSARKKLRIILKNSLKVTEDEFKASLNTEWEVDGRPGNENDCQGVPEHDHGGCLYRRGMAKSFENLLKLAEEEKRRLEFEEVGLVTDWHMIFYIHPSTPELKVVRPYLNWQKTSERKIDIEATKVESGGVVTNEVVTEVVIRTPETGMIEVVDEDVDVMGAKVGVGGSEVLYKESLLSTPSSRVAALEKNNEELEEKLKSKSDDLEELTKLSTEQVSVSETLIHDHITPADVSPMSNVANLDAETKDLESFAPVLLDKTAPLEVSPTPRSDERVKLAEKKLAQLETELEQERGAYEKNVEQFRAEIAKFIRITVAAKKTVKSLRNTVRWQNAELERAAKKERRNARISFSAFLITSFMLILYLMGASIGSVFSNWVTPTPVKVTYSINNEQNEFCSAADFSHTNTTDLIDPATLNGVCYGKNAVFFLHKTITITVPAPKLEPSPAEHAVMDLHTPQDANRQYGLFETSLAQFNETRAARLLNAALFFGSMGATAVGGRRAYRALHR